MPFHTFWLLGGLEPSRQASAAPPYPPDSQRATRKYAWSHLDEVAQHCANAMLDRTSHPRTKRLRGPFRGPFSLISPCHASTRDAEPHSTTVSFSRLNRTGHRFIGYRYVPLCSPPPFESNSRTPANSSRRHSPDGVDCPAIMHALESETELSGGPKRFPVARHHDVLATPPRLGFIATHLDGLGPQNELVAARLIEDVAIARHLFWADARPNLP